MQQTPGFHTFTVGEKNINIQIEKITPAATLDMIYHAFRMWEKGGNISVLIKNYILKGLHIDHKQNILKDGTELIDTLEIDEYIDLLDEAVRYQIDFEKLGKSKLFQKMGIDPQKAKEKIDDLIAPMNSTEEQ